MLSTLWIQKDLNFLGYNAGAEDGILGPNTRNAVRSFQQDFKNVLAVDGIPGEQTSSKLMYIVKKSQEILGVTQDGLAGSETNKAHNEFRNIKYFKRSEFNCGCGCGFNHIDVRLVKILDMIREHFGKPIIITSGVRCVNYNKRVGGVTNSFHVKNKAADFYVQGVNVYTVLSYCQTLVNQRILNYTYTNNTNMKGAVHIDIGGIL